MYDFERENRNNAPCRNEHLWIYAHCIPSELVKQMTDRQLMMCAEQTYHISCCAFLIDNPEWKSDPTRWGARWVPLKPQWASFMPKRPRFATHIVTRWMWESRENYEFIRQLALKVCDEADWRWKTQRKREIRTKLVEQPFPHRLPGNPGTKPPIWSNGQWLRDYADVTSEALFKKAVLDEAARVKSCTFTNREVPEFVRRSQHG